MKYLLSSVFAILAIAFFTRDKKTQPLPPEAMPHNTGYVADPPPSNKINGLTFVAPPEPFVENPMPAINDLGANWISVVPYAFTRKQVPAVRYHEVAGKWWGESPEGAKETIRLAHQSGLKVMLKPQVWIPGDWTGNLDFPSDSAWTLWEKGYEKYILRFATMADSAQVDLFCIGTEFRNAIEKRPQFWAHLIQKIKAVYSGKLTYSSNWDDWDKVPFWPQLDYIGLGGYFPLIEAKEPAVKDLKTAWQPIKERLKAFSQAQGKPILFTEWGYLSVDNCGWRNWELEQDIESRNINEQAQANCMEAMLATFQPEDWWAGSFLWKWFPNMRGHEGYPERDYTPQGKLAESVLRKWYR
jgi:hypothetical protein